MINKVGRDIPDALLTNGREVYQGKNYMDGKYIQKASPRTRRCEKPVDTKVVDSLVEALKQCGAKDGMTFSFHHHLRDGDYVVNQVMAAAIEELGLKDLTIAATSLGSAHDPIADYIEEGKVIGIQTSGIRGRMGEVVPVLLRPARSTSTSPSLPLPPATVWATAGASAARATAAPWATPCPTPSTPITWWWLPTAWWTSPICPPA